MFRFVQKKGFVFGKKALAINVYTGKQVNMCPESPDRQIYLLNDKRRAVSQLTL